ncbi:MAG: hypothetical protein IJM63_05415 [Solobacterium sp.]|nr:hypothetical protein [Solobacterium sp.]MBQ9823914.1 hypothetical protein [Solobacterium sp.]
MNNIEKVYAAISSDPALLDRLFEETKPAEDAPVTRSMPWGNQAESNTELKEILGTDVTEDDINKVLDELKDNQVVQLYRQSEGAIDAKELLDYVGDLSGTKAGSDNKALRALFDGKLQLKEIIMIILLLKLFKKKQQTTGYTNNNLLNTLLGGSTQQSTTNSLFNSLFGSNYGTGYGTNYGLGSNYGYTTIYPSSGSSLLNLFGLGTSNSNYNNSYSSLNNFLTGNSSQSQMQQLYNLLNGQSQTSVYNNGQVSVNSLFSILNSLLGGR